MKTLELIGDALDLAVAKCEGRRENDFGWWWDSYHPSTDWEQAGQIIKREGINLRVIRKKGHALDGQWLAAYDHGNTGSMVQWVKRVDWKWHYLAGPTPLVAAMRCYVASKLGDTVEINEAQL